MNKNQLISISMENTKMGPIPSFSLMPVVTCANGCPCVKECYAKRIACRYQSVRKSWEKNTNIAKRDPLEVMKQLNAWLVLYQPIAFRFHVAGDFVSEKYLNALCDVARSNPNIKFFAFTKQFDILAKYIEGNKIPKNFNIILSAWMNKNGTSVMPPENLCKKFNVAYVKRKGCSMDAYQFHHGEPKPCGGMCSECGMCFKKFHDVIFDMH